MWFHVMLKRTTTMSDEDKRIVEEKINISTQYKEFPQRESSCASVHYRERTQGRDQR